MVSHYVGEIRLIACIASHIPSGWTLCDGSVLQISSHTALFGAIGVLFGGDGINTFALPDLRGRVPIHMGQGSGLSNYNLAQSGGAETVTLTSAQMPTHTHNLAINVNTKMSTSNDPSTGYICNQYINSFNATSNTQLTVPATNYTIGSIGNSNAHNNMQPCMGMNYIIAIV